MENKYRIIKISQLFGQKEFDKNKDLNIFSEFVYKETIKLEEERDLYYNGSIGDLYESIKYLHQDYPNFRSWYFEKVVPNLMNGTREVLLCFHQLDNDESKNLKLAGLAILKKTEEERKICTFRVAEEFRGRGIAKILFEECFKVLETRLPLITISEKRKKYFEKYIEMFNFECTGSPVGIYAEDKKEYIYNGRLD